MRAVPYVFFLLFTLQWQTGRADATSPTLPSAEKPSASIELNHQIFQDDIDSGVVTNQVVTVAGQDFFYYFASAWRDQEGSEQYSLAVHELPSARWGSEIWIEFAQRKVFRINLPPSRSAIKAISLQAAEATFRTVQQTDFQRRLLVDADLARDEF